jgi:lipid-binding SYLF domain-containing protein
MKIIFKFLSMALLLTIFLSSCSIPNISNPLNTPKAAAQIDARVFKTIEQMYAEYPYSEQLAAKASALLVMPLVTEAGFGFGAGYGRGALVVNGSVKNYYSSISANTGIQLGAQQYAHVLFFMTDKALTQFEYSMGFSAGGDLEYITPSISESLKVETLTTLSPVIALVFGQAGLKVGATLEGSKYTKLRF